MRNKLLMAAGLAAAVTAATPASAAYLYQLDITSSASGVTGSVAWETGRRAYFREYKQVACTMSFGCNQYVQVNWYRMSADEQYAGITVYSPTSLQTVFAYFNLKDYEALGRSLATIGSVPLFTGTWMSGADAKLSVTYDGVPEPATWALMILGFGAVGAAMRKRRYTATVRFAAQS